MYFASTFFKASFINHSDGFMACLAVALLVDFVDGKWRAQGDDFRTFLVDFVTALPGSEISGELNS